jgi:predicted enzyme related to lactoylglutathione lyase
MTDKKKQPIGSIGWRDLTVEHADEVRDFYAAVAGWKVEPVDMGGYSDYTMMDAAGQPAGGVCHARGPNADIPPQWLIYVVVENLEKSLEETTKRGGAIVSPSRGLMGGKMAVVQDPAGAVVALWEE